MKYILILFTSFLLFLNNLKAQTSYNWIGSTSSNWNTAANWAPNGIPGPSDNVTIVTGANNCIISANTTVNNLVMNNGVLNIGAFTFSVNGTTNIIAGTIAATTGTLFCSGSTVNFGNGSGGPIINSIVNVNSPSILTQRTTYNNTVIFTKTKGNVSNASTGGNTFNSSLTLNYFSTIGSGYWSMANGISDIYNGDVTLNNNSLDRIILCHNSNANQFNGNIILNQTGSSNGISLSWNTNTGGRLANGKTITTGTYDVGYLYLQGITQAGTDAINITTTGTSQVYIGRGTGVNTNIFNGPITITAPRIWATGSTYNNSVTFNKTGAGVSHNDQRQNIFNGTVEINNTSTGYFMLGYNSNDLFNENIIVSSTNGGDVNIGWVNGSSSTPVLANGKTILIGAGGFNSGRLRLGGFTQTGAASSINLTLTGTAGLLINTGTANSLFEGSFSVTAPDITVQGGTFNGPAVFTKTGGTNTHNNGFQNIFNSTCTINQQSNTGYFMLGYNSNCLFNDDIVVTSTGTNGIYLGFSSGTGTPTLASGKTIIVGGAGFNSGFLYLGGFTQLGSAPINLNFAGTSTALTIRASSIGGNFTSNSGNIILNSNLFSGTANFTKIGAGDDVSQGGNTFMNNSSFTNNGSGYLLLGNINADSFNNDVVFTNNSTGSRILPAWNSAGNQFNGNITVNSTGSSTGIHFCGGSTVATATLAATKTIYTGTFNSGYLILPRFTQLGNEPININLSTGSNYVQYGPSTKLGGNITSISPNARLEGCEFVGTSDFTITGVSNYYNPGGNIFNGTSSITHNGSGFFLLGNTNPDIWNSDVTFTNNSDNRILPAWGSLGNLFNGNIYVNTSGSAQGIQFCGGNATATATLAATKTIAAGMLGLNAGYLILKQFTQLGNAPINLTLNSTATYLQYGPLSYLGGNVTSVSPRLLFNGCVFNGTTNCTKNGATDDDSNGTNTFVGASTITNTGSGRILLGNLSTDIFMSTANFNNLGSNHMYIAHNSSNNIFSGVVTFSNAPTGNFGIYVSGFSTGTIFNENIIVSNVNGAGVQFCYGNSTATSTLAAGKTITIGPAGFNTGTLLLKQFSQIGATPQSLNITSGNALLQLGPTSSFDGNVNFNFPQVLLNGTTYNGLATIEKNGASDNDGTGGNIFNATTIITNSGSGRLQTGSVNRDQFNALTTFNNTGSARFHFAQNHGGQTTTFAQDLILNSNKSGGTDTWSYFICEGTNTSVQYNGNVTYNVQGSLQSNCRVLQGASSTATYNGNLTINLTNSHAGSRMEMGTNGISNYNGNIIVQNTAGGTSSGIFFNIGATSSSTLAAGKTIILGAGGFVSGNLSLIRFTQLSATTQTLLQTTGNARLILGPTNVFNGNVTFNFPQLFLNGTTYNGTATLQKNGATDNTSVGGNIFNGITEVINSSSNFLRLANSSADSHNSDVTFTQNGSGALAPNYNTNCTYLGNITVNSTTTNTITFGSGSGIATITGSNAQTINKTGTSANPNFTRLVINKASNDVTLNTRINITNTLSLIQGLINTSTTNILNMNDLSNTSIGNTSSYINGPMQYAMASNSGTRRSLNLPIGKTSDWRPAVIQVAHTTNTNYTYRAEVFNASAEALSWTKPATVSHVSYMHYWDIDRFTTSTMAPASSNDLRTSIGVNGPVVTLYYGANDGVTDPTNLTICKNTNGAPTTWIDIGGTGATVTSGNITSTSSPSSFNSFSRFTLANIIGGINPLPVELVEFSAVKNSKKVDLNWVTASEINNSHFEIERSKDGINFEKFKSVKAHGDGNSSNKQIYNAIDENPYSGLSYYRLKQIDKDKSYSYSQIQLIEYSDKGILIYPNPSNGTIHIKTENQSKLSFIIYNSAGEKVLESMNTISDYNTIDLSNFSNGIYTIVSDMNGEITVTKLILIQ